MKERPILFSGPMVRALLDGSKTQTRRVVKPQPDSIHDGEPYWHIGGYRAWAFRGVTDPLRMGTHNPVRCPHGQPGDLLWVRETFAEGIHQLADVNHWAYAADLFGNQQRLGDRWKPSIHMPRWASRITLEVTGVRVERLQEISEADAIAEGIERGDGFPGWYRGPLAGDSPGLRQCGLKIPTAFPKLAYRALWESINGPRSWDENPWVWVVEFKNIATNQIQPCANG